MKTAITLSITSEDITKLHVDIIVNAANSALGGGGGVDGAIHRAAGPELAEECRAFGYFPPGKAVLTKAYNLPALYVIHAVGPVWWGGNKNEHNLLASCYHNTLRIAQNHNAKSMAFPTISCGAYKFPIEDAAKIAIDTIITTCEEIKFSPDILLVCFNPRVKRAYEQHLTLISTNN